MRYLEAFLILGDIQVGKMNKKTVGAYKVLSSTCFTNRGNQIDVRDIKILLFFELQVYGSYWHTKNMDERGRLRKKMLRSVKNGRSENVVTSIRTQFNLQDKHSTSKHRSFEGQR